MMTDKDINRYKHSTWILWMVFILIGSVVGLASADKLTSEFTACLIAILGYAGNNTYQNYRTSPKD